MVNADRFLTGAALNGAALNGRSLSRSKLVRNAGLTPVMFAFDVPHVVSDREERF